MKNDRNDKNVKQVSRLTGALLAKKGTAAPSPATLSMNQPVLNRFAPLASVAEPVDVAPVEAAPKDITKPGMEKSAVKRNGKVSHRKSVSHESSKEPAVKSRIAMTLRMDSESHLKLRLFSAHTRKSCQEILSEALDFYLEDNADKFAPQPLAVQQR